MLRTAEKYLKEELNIEMPKESLNLAWFSEMDLPMIVSCTSCGSTMLLVSAMIDENGSCFCHSCADEE